YSQAFVVLPGGFGTLDEVFEAITLVQTRKITRFPIVLVGTRFWSGLLDWIRDQMLAIGKISPQDLDLIHLTDDPQEAVQVIVEGHSRAEQEIAEARAQKEHARRLREAADAECPGAAVAAVPERRSPRPRPDPAPSPA